MKYSVGDKVRVRKDLKVGKRYGNDIFIKEMKYMKGEIVTIEKVFGYDYFIKEFDYSWTDEMLEPVEDIIEYKGKKYDVVYANVETFDLALHLKEHKEEILDKEEKEYLRNVIKYVIEPTHNEVEYIVKINDGVDYYITIHFENDFADVVTLPYFKDKRMYKGMEIDKEYTLEDLGL